MKKSNNKYRFGENTQVYPGFLVLGTPILQKMVISRKTDAVHFNVLFSVGLDVLDNCGLYAHNVSVLCCSELNIEIPVQKTWLHISSHWEQK